MRELRLQQQCALEHVRISPGKATFTRTVELDAATDAQLLLTDCGHNVRLAGEGTAVRSVTVDGPKLERKSLHPRLKSLLDAYKSLDARRREQLALAGLADERRGLLANHVESQLATQADSSLGLEPSFLDEGSLSTLLQVQGRAAEAAATAKNSALQMAKDLEVQMEVVAAEMAQFELPLSFGPSAQLRDLTAAVGQHTLVAHRHDCRVDLAAVGPRLTIRSDVYGVSWRAALNVQLFRDAARPSGFRATVDLDAVISRPFGEDWTDVDVQFVASSESGRRGVPTPPRRKVELRPTGSPTNSKTGVGGAASHTVPSSAKGRAGVVANKVTVRGDCRTQYIPLLRNVEVSAEVFRYAVPDREEAVYLLVSLTNSTGADFCSDVHEAAVFLDGTHVGTATIRGGSFNDGESLTLAVGPDPAISLTQKTVPEVRAKEGYVIRSDKNELEQEVFLTGCDLAQDTPVAVLYACPRSSESTIKVSQKVPSEATKLSGLTLEACVVEALQKFGATNSTAARQTFVEEATNRYIDVVLIPRNSAVSIKRKRVVEHPADTKLRFTETFAP